jgi:hypothetical protein
MGLYRLINQIFGRKCGDNVWCRLLCCEHVQCLGGCQCFSWTYLTVVTVYVTLSELKAGLLC